MKKNLLIFFIGLLLVIFLSLVFSGRLILPQLFHLGPLTVHYYGIIIALAVGAAFYLAMKRAKIFGIDEKVAEDILFWTIIGGFVGARLYHVLSSLRYYSQHTAGIFKVWNGGLSIYGAVIGGVMSIIIYHRFIPTTPSPLSGATPPSAHPLGSGRRGILQLLDWLAPSVVLGQIIGRFGNLFNYEAYGYPTNLPWKMFVPPGFRPEQYQTQNFFHPWFLYEALGNAAILFLLLKIIKPKAHGDIVFLYLLLYNALRFGLEFIRIDSVFIGAFRQNAITSLILAAVGLLGFIYVRICQKKYSNSIKLFLS